MPDQGELTPERPTRVLVIDDNERIHFDFRKILVSRPHAGEDVDICRAAFYGVEKREPEKPRCVTFALASARQGCEGYDMVVRAVDVGRPYTIAFVDVRMPPGWDGIETVKRIWSKDPDLQVVICTAYSDYSRDEMVRQLGRSDQLSILKKPFNTFEVRHLASTLTAKWRLARRRPTET